MNALRPLTTAKTFLMATVFSAISLTSLAQATAGKIIGTIGDDNQKPVESATISLLNAKDSSGAGSTASDKTGHFYFNNIHEGKYLVSASSIGHTTSFSPLFEVSAGNAV